MFETVGLKIEGQWWCLFCAADHATMFGSKWAKDREAFILDSLDELYAHLEQHKIYKEKLKLSLAIVKLP